MIHGPEQGDPLLAQRGAEHAVVLAALREGRPPVAELGRHHRSLVVEDGRAPTAGRSSR